MGLLTKAKLTSDDLGFSGLRNINGGILRQLYDRLHGRSRDTLHNCSGLALTLEGALIRSNISPSYTLAVRLGDRVVPVLDIPAHDPLIRELPIEHFAPSPSEIAQERRQRELAAMNHKETIESAVAYYRALGIDAHVWDPAGGQPRPPPDPRNHNPNVQVP